MQASRSSFAVRTSSQTFAQRRARIVRAVAVCILLATGGIACAATVTVTSTADTVAVDGGVTLREAILSIDNGVGVNTDVVALGSYGNNDTINFNIPGSGVHTVAVSALPGVTRAVKIDGYSQPLSQPNSNAPTQGTNAVLLIELNIASGSLFLGGGNSTVQGLVVNGVAGSIVLANAGGNTIAGNFIGTSADGTSATAHLGYNVQDIIVASSSPGNTIGGNTPAARNLISGSSDAASQNAGISLASAGNTVQGNLIGTDASGNAAIANDIGIDIAIGGADDNLIGGTTAAQRNIISGNRIHGVEVDTSGNLLRGNFIGTDASGSKALANGDFGIAVGGTGNIVGGTAAGCGNVVSGNASVGIAIASGATGNVIQGNFIGTDASGSLPLGGHSIAGIEVSGGGNMVGGSAAGAGNIIAFNAFDGVRVDGGTGSSILQNSIFSNGGLGIELGSAGIPYSNDVGDSDVGPNNFQNYPVLTSTWISGNNVSVAALLNSTPGSAFHIEFFASAHCGHFGHGEGRTSIGSADVVSDLNGNANVAARVLAVPGGNTVLTATAMDASGSTSEFSACSFADDLIFANGLE